MSAEKFLIQAILLLTILAISVFFIANRRKARTKAGVKISFVLFLIASFWTILRPDDLSAVANFLGVDRGTDLLLYALVMAFLFTTVSTYIRFREVELKYARLARAVALEKPLPPSHASEEDDFTRLH